MFQMNAVEEIKMHTLCTIFFFSENHAICNVGKYGTDIQTTDDITRHMRIACWITEATNTLRICNTYCLSTATMVARTCLNDTSNTRCLTCLVWALL